jgi:hypothetical protein
LSTLFIEYIGKYREILNLEKAITSYIKIFYKISGGRLRLDFSELYQVKIRSGLFHRCFRMGGVYFYETIDIFESFLFGIEEVRRSSQIQAVANLGGNS